MSRCQIQTSRTHAWTWWWPESYLIRWERMPIQLATLQLATLQLVTFQLATLTTRHPDNSSLFNSPPWQLATLTTRHFSTCHPDNSPPWQLVTPTTCHSNNSPPYNSPLWQLATITTRHHGVYAWIILFVLITGIFYFNVCTAYCSPDFSFNILLIFGSDQWDLLSHNLFVIFFIRWYRCFLQMNYIPCPKFCVVVFVD
jgi:hypothetical protein